MMTYKPSLFKVLITLAVAFAIQFIQTMSYSSAREAENDVVESVPALIEFYQGYAPGEIMVLMKEITDTQSFLSSIPEIQIETIGDNRESLRNTLPEEYWENLPDYTWFGIVLADKSNENLFRSIESIKKNPNVLSVELNSISFLDPEEIPRIPLPIQNTKPIDANMQLDDGMNENSRLAYLEGYPDGTIHQDDPITRAEVATMLYRLANDANKESSYKMAFRDVQGDEWYAPMVFYVVSKAVMFGYSNAEFRPEAYMNRSEFAKMITLLYSTGYDGTLHYTDVSSDHWAERSIVACETNGWMVGYEDGTFRPDDLITRAEAVTVLNRVLGWAMPSKDDSIELAKYLDLSESHWAYWQIMLASVPNMNKSA